MSLLFFQSAHFGGTRPLKPLYFGSKIFNSASHFSSSIAAPHSREVAWRPNGQANAFVCDVYLSRVFNGWPLTDGFSTVFVDTFKMVGASD
ncbi:hypothetical protein [Congregibacter litoralis]|uniref:hypothetical protein n=1 Tax=Congregibacter litoralis TaxID=393662 RepID=UPI0012601F6F|nr:hypothetical protein [Congregibacter litoralis]